MHTSTGKPLNFSAPTKTLSLAAMLFDMDGTIIDSTPAVVKYWMSIGEELGIPGEKILETSHGRRSIDILADIAPDRADWDYVKKAEGEIPRRFGHDAIELPGSRTILDQLEEVNAPWGIVTSGTEGLVSGWLEIMKLARPKILVSAEHVEKGKPDPACYRLGAKRLGVDGDEIAKSDILVLEDAPAGVRAGKAAGYRVVALATTHSIAALREAGADWIVEDLRSVSFRKWEPHLGRITVDVLNALENKLDR